MDRKHTSPRILFPRTIGEILELSGNESEAVFWAGGTRLAQVAPQSGDFIQLPRTVISLGMVEELARASRSEHGLEIGAMMSLDRLAAIGRSALPPGLPETLSLIGNRPLRCRATIGGHLAQKDQSGDLLPLLQLLETKVEIRYLQSRRGRRKPAPALKKIPLARLEEETGLMRGDLITRISIPTENWNFAVVEKLPPTGGRTAPLIFQAVARVEKSVMVEWRLALSDGSGDILRNRDAEALLAGRPLPFTDKELDALSESIEEMTRPWEGRETDRETAVCLALNFMRKAAG